MTELVSITAAQNCDADVVLGSINVLAAGLHCANSVLDEFIGAQVGKRLEILLEVGLSRLVSVANRNRVIFVVVTGGAGFKEMSSCLVDGADKKTNSEGTLCWMGSLDLALGCNLSDQSLGWVVAAVRVPVVKALFAHELAQEPGISGHS